MIESTATYLRSESPIFRGKWSFFLADGVILYIFYLSILGLKNEGQMSKRAKIAKSTTLNL